MIDGDVFECARRDARTDRVAWILDDGYTAVAFDFVEAGGAVVEPSGQQHADHASARDLGCAGKQRIDRRPAPVYPRAARERDVASPHEKGVVRRGDVNFAGADQLALLGEMRVQERMTVQDAGKLAWVRPHVKDGEERGGDLAGKVGKQLLHRLDASVRGPNNDNGKIAGGFLLHASQRAGARRCSYFAVQHTLGRGEKSRAWPETARWAGQ